jgi:hypothetical protein
MINQEETAAAVAAKAALPVGVSLATIFGMQVSDLLMWMTLIYTVLLIVHKVWLMYKDFRKK